MSLSKRFDLVIFDWAGTMVDHGCCAPVLALVEAFANHGVSLTDAQARKDMGKAKADHVSALLADAAVREAWAKAQGRLPTAADAAQLVMELGPLMRDQAAVVATLIEGAREAVDTLRSEGLKIASSTGYTREMMEPVLARAAQQGYVPDHLLCSGDTVQGRPSPLMIYRACADLGVWPLSRVVKVDDAEAGVAEGRAAGCFTVGLAASGNGVGLSAAALAALSETQRQARIEASSRALYAAGANLVINSVADLVFALRNLD